MNSASPSKYMLRRQQRIRTLAVCEEQTVCHLMASLAVKEVMFRQTVRTAER